MRERPLPLTSRSLLTLSSANRYKPKRKVRFYFQLETSLCSGLRPLRKEDVIYQRSFVCFDLALVLRNIRLSLLSLLFWNSGESFLPVFSDHWYLKERRIPNFPLTKP